MNIKAEFIAEVPKETSLDSFIDDITEFVESKGWKLYGSFREVDNEGNLICE